MEDVLQYLEKDMNFFTIGEIPPPMPTVGGEQENSAAILPDGMTRNDMKCKEMCISLSMQFQWSLVTVDQTPHCHCLINAVHGNSYILKILTFLDCRFKHKLKLFNRLLQ